ncbi:MAG: family 20 glycosylhydrolase [Porphyromonas sp.]|nr:family 20 glycosylhydrolase [Porphyromonas sp.]
MKYRISLFVPILLLSLFFIGVRPVSAQKPDSNPSNAYEWRGCMIDVSRHFFTIDVLKKQIDVLSSYGINRLHLHLTDAGGWRFVFPAYPRLATLAAWRTESDWDKWWGKGDRRYLPEGTPGAYGGYYTESELRDLILYASERGVMIVPEVEIPGHSEEVTEAYPELKCEGNTEAQADICPSNPASYKFIDELIAEVVRIFPSEYIHIGGDEAGKIHWRTCPRCLAMAKQLGLKSTDELQDHIVSYAMRRVLEHGRKPVCWDDALCSSLPQGSIIMVWRDVAEAQRALDMGYDVVFSPSQYCYLDYAQDAPQSQPRSFGGYLPLKRVWEMQPPKGILGVQGNLWTEYVSTPEHLEYMLYPRMLAVAEVGRLGEKRPPYDEFRAWAQGETDHLRSKGINSFDLRREQGDRKESLQPTVHNALGAKVVYHRPFYPSYNAGGEQALVDGLRGNWQHGDGRWQGFLGENCLDLTLDLGEIRTLHSISMDFLQVDVAGIYLPKDLVIMASADGENFVELFRKQHPKEPRTISFIENWAWKGEANVRYLRITGKAESRGEWIFTDEIVIR